ncbi:carbohydrate ABC transporter permease [Jiangella ureilytica]|uniref:Carbohydrate ABC transporter permease n=1 Tax=Jiangella ureilytica TaxID=2530374 RepID=A0A4R4RBS9_9ACTN|nr:carbohydrate ABC transporter permease [Jiangella ureilytica]TDC46517.1 carbohydrate ABC transporter permease [Jiangella ureilytica]
MAVQTTTHGAGRVAGGSLRVGFLMVCAVFFGLPVVWLILAATKTQASIFSDHPLSMGSLGNIAQGWSNLLTFNDGELVGWIWNSLYYAGSSVVIATVLSVPAGYALAKYDFAGRKALLVLTLIGMIIPTAALVLPLYLQMNALGLLGTPASVILPLAFYPFAVYLCYVYCTTSLPDSLLEAARVDGASEAALFFRIVLPLSKPIIGMIFFFSFVHAWTSFFLPFVMLSDDRTFNLQVGLMMLLQSTDAINAEGGFAALPIHQPEAALAALVAVAPVLVAFLFAQRYLTASDVSGAEKG